MEALKKQAPWLPAEQQGQQLHIIMTGVAAVP
jgi:hypothetical protein